MTGPRPRKIVIAGGGVAAVEAALTLRELAPPALDISLLAPGRTFELAPETVREAAGGPPAARYDLRAIADDLEMALVEDALEGVDPARRRAMTRGGGDLLYDGLLVALGALPGPVLPGSLRFGGRPDVARVRAALARMRELPEPHIAFVATGGVGWTLPLYELALLVAAAFGADGRSCRLTVVTPEAEPLALFGHPASRDVRRRLLASHVDVRAGTSAEAMEDGSLWLATGGSIPVDLAIALPEPVGPGIPGLPVDPRGFVPVDRHGRVHGVDGVWAAGDLTARPLKQGGLAAQQAAAAAESMAAWAGAPVVPRPYEPVLRGVLLTGDAPRYLRRAVASAVPSAASDRPLWAPVGKLVGGRIGPYLARQHDLNLDMASGTARWQPPTQPILRSRPRP